MEIDTYGGDELQETRTATGPGERGFASSLRNAVAAGMVTVLAGFGLAAPAEAQTAEQERPVQAVEQEEEVTGETRFYDVTVTLSGSGDLDEYAPDLDAGFSVFRPHPDDAAAMPEGCEGYEIEMELKEEAYEEAKDSEKPHFSYLKVADNDCDRVVDGKVTMESSDIIDTRRLLQLVRGSETYRNAIEDFVIDSYGAVMDG